MVHYDTQAPPEPTQVKNFQKGDEIFLSKGTYQGTLGIFLNIKDGDDKWADILEQDSQIRPHPLEWIEHYQPAANSDPAVIQASAYECWVARGRPVGSPEIDWLRAEEGRKNEGAKEAA